MNDIINFADNLVIVKQYIFLTIALILLSAQTKAQQDSVVTTPDSVIIDAGGATVYADEEVEEFTDTTLTTSDTIAVKKLFQPNPKKAGMYSSILPGAGQLYNRQYWKLPLVYGAFGTMGFFIKYNYDKYIEYRSAYISRLDASSANDVLPLYSVNDIKRQQDLYRKDLDILVLVTAVLYGAQILDAIASAHLKNFDITPDISMNLEPVIQNNYAGIGLVFHLE